MNQFQLRFRLFILLMLMVAVACRAQTSPPEAVNIGGSNEAVAPPIEAEKPAANLPMLPAFQEVDSNGIGSPLTSGTEDPFADAAFNLATELPQGLATAVVQQHNFGQLDEAKARAVANQFGFTGPLYVQQIAPEFAPPPDAKVGTTYTAFDGQRLINISHTGLTYENRGVVVDYNKRPIFAEVAPVVEAQLKEWGVLIFPYELRELPTGDLVIYRLIDSVAVEQNAFNVFFNDAGEIAYFDFHPLREVEVLGNYPLQTAKAAWQRLQTSSGRQQSRYQLNTPPTAVDDSVQNFVNPGSWAPVLENGQEMHLYITPAVYEATDGSGLHLVHGPFTLKGNQTDLDDIATHLSDVLHVWGIIGEANGAKTLTVTGWDKVEMMQYESFEGTILREDGQTLLQTLDNDLFLLPASPKDMPTGIEVFVSAAARRDIGAAYPVLDWMTITEKVEWPEMPITMPEAEAAVIQKVTIDSVTLIYFTVYQTIDTELTDSSQLYVPVWKFSGITDQGQQATFWVPAVATEYMQALYPNVFTNGWQTAVPLS